MKTSNLDDIAADFASFAKRVHIELGRDLILDMNATANGGAGYGEPVLSGQMAASIRGAVGDSADALYHYDDKSFDGIKYRGMERAIPNPSTDFLVTRLKDFQLGDSIHVGNTLDYAEELDNGSSRKAPNGIREPTMNRFRSLVRERMAVIRVMLKTQGIG